MTPRYTVTRNYYQSGAKAGQPDGTYSLDNGGQRLKLPSVTTVIKGGLPAPQLMTWALRTGVQAAVDRVREAVEAGTPIDAAQLARIQEEALAQPDRARDDAADVGTQVHQEIERFLLGAPPPPGWQPDPRVLNGLRQFQEFWRAEGLEMEQHFLEFPIASLRHCYAGTVDCIALDGQFRRVVVDWKTSKAIYDSHEIQGVAYAHAVEEMGIGRVDRVIIARFGREDAEFESREIEPTLWPGHFDQFLRCLGTYDWQRAAGARYRARRKA